MKTEDTKQIKIIACSNSIYWYNKHIGETFDVQSENQQQYWVREKDAYSCLNFVLKSDSEIIN